MPDANDQQEAVIIIMSVFFKTVFNLVNIWQMIIY